MKTFFKTMAVLLICLLMMSSVLACSSGTPSDSGNTPDPAKTPVTDPEKTADAPAGIPAADLKVALILNGSITDASWNANGYNGMVAASKALGFKFAYIENVQTAEMEATIRDYAEQDYDLICAHGAQFQDAMLAVAPNYPEIKFFTYNGEKVLDNHMVLYNASDESAFLSGALAALMAKNGKVGWIGAVEVPTAIQPRDGFIAGAKYINPNIDISTAFVGSYSDTAKAKELALTMFENGVDYIQSNANQGTAGIIEAAKEFGGDIMLCGNTTDQYEMAPEYFITSVTIDFSAVYKLVAENVINGTFTGSKTLGTVANGIMTIAPYHDFEDKIPAEVKAKIEEIKTKIINGEMNAILPLDFSDFGRPNK